MNKSETNPQSGKPRFLKAMIVFTVIVVAIILIAQLAVEQIRSVLPWYESGIANLITYVGVLLLCIAWCGWLVVFSRQGFWKSKALPVGLFLLMCGTVYCYRPVPSGDLGISGFECIFAKVQYEPMNVTGEKISLQDETDSDFWQFLGPKRDGVIDHVEILADWKSNEPEVVWKKQIGMGWGGFAAVDDYAYTLEQRIEKEIVTCRKISNGDIVWAHEHDQRHEAPMGGVGPRSTPTVHNGKVFANGGTGILMCLNAEDGKLLWQKDIPKLVGIEMTEKTNSKGTNYQVESSKLMWGRSASPLIYKDTVIIPGGGPTNGKQVTLIAFSIKDGSEKWRGGDLSIGYGSPSLYTIGGVEQVLLTTESKIASFEPTTGKTLWTFDRAGNSNGDAQSSQPIAIDSNTLLLTKGYGLGGELIKVEKSGDKWTTQSLWKKRRVLQTKFTNAIHKGKYVYSISEKVMECVEIETGKRIWRKLRVGHGQMLLVGDHLLIQSERGDVILIDATPEWLVERARIRRVIKGRCWNTMCLQNGYLLIRSEKQAACLKLPLKNSDGESRLKETQRTK